ncbi:DUF3987 domain-containing protein [Octadecabacter antarcticus]|uniref:DUF3987 domain-containing protein n=1 Tax=Octadecabacter antarcticus TaxID=1217908 RepID=UPI001FDFD87B|nr:DUF3987 domain-containing protein [Octadecabacter antarcticus]
MAAFDAFGLRSVFEAALAAFLLVTSLAPLLLWTCVSAEPAALFATLLAVGLRRVFEARKSSKGESCVSTPESEPTPLYGELSQAQPIPWLALGPLAEPVRAISTLTQAPDAIAMQSLLAVVSTATQGLADAEALHGAVPISLFLITVAQSGERKSACDGLATAAIKEVDQERERHHRLSKRVFEAELLKFQKGQRRKRSNDSDVIEGAFIAPKVDLAPEPPLVPTILISDVTIEGVFRRLETGTPSVAVIADEGGQFFGGHSMKRENALKTATGFSKFWDGTLFSKARASSEPVVLYGKRVSLHLMIQPGVAQDVVGDPMMKDQGFLSRVLIARPDSKIGSRKIRKDAAYIGAVREAKAVMLTYNERMTCAPKTPPDLCRVRPTKGRTNEGTIYRRTDHSNYQRTGIW